MNKKGLLAGALVVVSVAAISIGSTFALLKDKTATKANVFTATAGLTGQIKEDLFDGLDYDGTQVDPQPEKLGKDLALNVVPGRVIPKDPQVKNTSATDAAWIAVKLDVSCDGKTGAEALAEIAKFAEIDFNTTDWTVSADGLTYYYKTIVAANGGETTTLFNTVTIKDVDNASAIKGFNLNITAYLLQAEGTEAANVQTAFATAFNW